MEIHSNLFGFLLIIWVCCCANAQRQIRYNRYTTEISKLSKEDPASSERLSEGELEARVREVTLYWTDIEPVLRKLDEVDEAIATTVTTTETYDKETATRNVIPRKAPYAPAGFRPRIPFNLPTENLLENEKEKQEEVTEDSVTSTPLAEFSMPAALAAEEEEKTPYPPAGLKPQIIFFLPNAPLFTEDSVNFRTENETKAEESTTLKQDTIIATTTTAENLETTQASETTTVNSIETTQEPETTAVEILETTTESNTKTPLAEFTTARPNKNTPYPAAGFKPKIVFLLPTENQQPPVVVQEQSKSNVNLKSKKAPYAAAGFRPSIPFLLPNEQLNDQEREELETEDKTDNSKHPACGSSTNPLRPKPLDGEKSDPDSETIFLNSQKVIVPARFTYTTHLRVL